MKFGPRNERERRVYAIEALRVDIQQKIHEAMLRAKVDNQELARRLGLPVERIDQLFDARANPTLSFLARVFHALGMELQVQFQPTKARGQ